MHIPHVHLKLLHCGVCFFFIFWWIIKKYQPYKSTHTISALFPIYLWRLPCQNVSLMNIPEWVNRRRFEGDGGGSGIKRRFAIASENASRFCGRGFFIRKWNHLVNAARGYSGYIVGHSVNNCSAAQTSMKCVGFDCKMSAHAHAHTHTRLCR